MIFKDVMASGEDMCAPSSTQPQTQLEDQDVYRPILDLEEGSGDNEEDLIGAPSIGVTNELEGVNLTTTTSNTAPSRPGGSGSYGKRKRDGGSERKKKQKTPSSQKIADAVSLIATTSKDTAEAIKEIKDNEVNEITTTDLTRELLSIEEIARDKVLCVKCCNLLAYKPLRDIYIGLRDDREMLVEWLRYNAENPPRFVQRP